jgi:Holliday junction DNA helicase RuvA
MISQLTGKISHKNEQYLILDVQGLGYKIHATGDTLKVLKDGENFTFWTHLAVRENALDLYGFLTKEELSFFELLITIPGIGPKSAINILNVVSIESLSNAVSSGNVAHLVKVSGLGKKTAEKIVLELQGKVGDEKDFGAEQLRDEGDAVEALTALGYSQREARQALKDLPQDVSGTSNRVRYALRLLSK